MKDMYAKGSKGIKTKKMTAEKFEDSPEDKKVDAKAMAKMNKSGKYAAGTGAVKVKPIGPFSGEEIDDTTKATIANKDLTTSLDVAAKEDKTSIPTPSLNPNKIADMAKVRQHQEKLNKYGAGLKVDGIWGDKTEAASRDLYPQYKEQTKTRQPTISTNSTVNPVQAKSTGIKTTSTATKTTSPQYRSDAETSQASNDLVNKPTGIKTTSKSGLSNFIKTEGDKRPLTTIQKERKTQTAANAEEEVKKIDEQLALRKQDPGVAEAAANNPVPGMGAFAAHISDSANGGKSISPEYREQLEARREQLRPTPKTVKSKSLDGGDAAIYGAEATGPALAKSIKGGGYAGIAKAALRFGPTAADILKTNYDDGFKTPIASTLKATARGAILGTAGSTVVGAGKRVASNIIGAGEESGKLAASMNRAKGAVEASEKAATGAMNKKAYDSAIAEGKTAQDELTGLASNPKPSLGIGKAFGDSFNNTGAGKAVTAVTQNKVISTIKGYRDLNKAKSGVTNAAASGASSGASGAAGTSSKGLTYLEQVAKKEADKVAKATAAAEAEAIKTQANVDRGIKTKATQAKNGVYDEAVKENKAFNSAAKKTANGIKTKRTEELKAIADKQLETAETANQTANDIVKQKELNDINKKKYGYKGSRTEPYQPATANAESERVSRRMNELADAGEKKIIDARVAGYKAKADGTKAKNSVFNEAAEENKSFDKKVDYTKISKKEQADIAAKKYSLNGKESVSARTKVTTYDQPTGIRTVNTEAKAKEAVKLKSNGKPNSAQRRSRR